MWEIIDKIDYKLFLNRNIELKVKVFEKQDYNEVHINYKRCNIAFAMEVWGFGAECKECNIVEKMIGNPVEKPSEIFFIISPSNTRAFVDLIYFFVCENHADGRIRQECMVDWKE